MGLPDGREYVAAPEMAATLPAKQAVCTARTGGRALPHGYYQTAQTCSLPEQHVPPGWEGVSNLKEIITG